MGKNDRDETGLFIPHSTGKGTMWLNWQRENRVLIVFIHGLFGSRWSTWKTLFDNLQADVMRSHIQPSSEFNLFGFNIYSWQYRSGLWRQPRLLPEIVDELDSWLKRITADDRYRSVILVCHSQGGHRQELCAGDIASQRSG